MLRGRVGEANQARVLREQVTQHSDVAFRAGVEESGGRCGLALVDFDLQRSPTGKAVIARDSQQSGRELDVRVGLTKLMQAILRQLFEVCEPRSSGGFRLGHRSLSS